MSAAPGSSGPAETAPGPHPFARGHASQRPRDEADRLPSTPPPHGRPPDYDPSRPALLKPIISSIPPGGNESRSAEGQHSRAAATPDCQPVNRNWTICAQLSALTALESGAPSRRSEIVRTNNNANNNAPFVALCNCEERCRLRTSGRKGQRIRVLGRTAVG